MVGQTEAMLFIYQSEVLPYAQIEKAMIALLNRFTQHTSPGKLLKHPCSNSCAQHLLFWQR